MKPEMQLKMYLLSEQGHMIEAESINTLSMDDSEMIPDRKSATCLFCHQLKFSYVSVRGKVRLHF